MINSFIFITDSGVQTGKHLVLRNLIGYELGLGQKLNGLLVLSHGLVNACLEQGQLCSLLLLKFLLLLFFHCLFEGGEDFQGTGEILGKVECDGIGNPVKLLV